jgi:hypothetical protein
MYCNIAHFPLFLSPALSLTPGIHLPRRDIQARGFSILAVVRYIRATPWNRSCQTGRDLQQSEDAYPLPTGYLAGTRRIPEPGALAIW